MNPSSKASDEGTSTMETCTITGTHCEHCGSTDPEDISNLADTDGYTRCCNELVAWDSASCRNHHGRA